MVRAKQFFSFDECRAYVQGTGVRSFKAWIAMKNRDPRAPSNPQRTYKAQWKGWTHFLGGTRRQRTPGADWAPYDEARAYARSLGCSSSTEWMRLSREKKLPDRIPTSPRQVYGKQFTGWQDFLGIDEPWMSYEEFETFVRDVLKISSHTQWKQLARDDLPPRAPSHPDRVYRGKGWQSWPALFGSARPPKPSHNRGKSIAERFPEIAGEWHATKNDGLDPASIVAASSHVAWWRCGKGHEWQAAVKTRTAGSKCPACAAENSIAHKYPELAKEWHPANDVSASDVSPGSGRKVKWRCSANPDHVWLMTPQARTGQRQGCPFCSGRRAGGSNTLAARYPDLAAQWHPTKNRDVTAADVVAGSHMNAWWRCSNGHEWKSVVRNRVKGASCPMCRGRVASAATSLASLRPDLANEWHPTKNGDLTPDAVTLGSSQAVWWRCPAGHEWSAKIANRVRWSGCKHCTGKQATPNTSLKALMPDIAARWHPSKNGTLTPDEVRPGSEKVVWWICEAGHEREVMVANFVRSPICPSCKSLSTLPEIAALWHPTKNGARTPADVSRGSKAKAWWRCAAGHEPLEWEAAIQKVASGTRKCSACSAAASLRESNLEATRPEIARLWHRTKNHSLMPTMVNRSSNRSVWWRCEKGHEWKATVRDVVKGSGCHVCTGRATAPDSSLAALFPDIAAEWHVEKNQPLLPTGVAAKSGKRVWWRCTTCSHEWDAVIASRTFNKSGCPRCAIVTPETCLAVVAPDLAREWHPAKNDRTPRDVVRGSTYAAWWQCSTCGHVWNTYVYARARNGTGCPNCNLGWTLDKIRDFVRSLAPHLQAMTPGERWVVFQQSGALDATGRNRRFVRALSTGRFPQEEVEKFVAGQPSTLEDYFEAGAPTPSEATDERNDDTDHPVAPELVEADQTGDEALPQVKVSEIFDALNAATEHASDTEAIEFLVASGKAKLWRRVFHDEQGAVEDTRAFTGTGYAQTIRDEFLREYEEALSLKVPPGYAFMSEGKLAQPLLMQRLVASQLLRHRRRGNWSGTGTGKTNSAILSSRVLDAKLTVVCCPNSVVDGWASAIVGMYPESEVACKTFQPRWQRANGHRYAVLNFEMFQQPDSGRSVAEFSAHHAIDFIVVDEIHFVKQRSEDVSRRRQVVGELITSAGAKNEHVAVLGMSATPVINNLREGIALVEMVTGKAHSDLGVQPTVPNAMRLFQRLTTIGPRWLSEHGAGYTQRELEVDCTELVDEIRTLGRRGTPLQLEEILTRARLPRILENIVPKTLIYTHYIGGTARLDRQLHDAISAQGWRVGFYTGDDKSGLEGFVRGDLDVLIGSSAIATGVDGLQHVCNRLIVNVLPWTAAEFEQLRGRIHRQGQSRHVDVIIPVTRAEVGGDQWSWCKAKMRRLHFKKSIADAAVDGVVPEGHLRSPERAYQDLMAWLERLATGTVAEIEREPVVFDSPDRDSSDQQRRVARFGDFSTMNGRWNQASSTTTHERLVAEPREWQHYHDELARVRASWAADPCDEIIAWAKRRTDLVIGDFGCGRAKLQAELSDRHVVHSFDHIAANSDVVACDMAHVPLDDMTLDVAVFSLSLMGANFVEYLREAYRTLRLDGWLHIFEATSRFTNADEFVAGLRDLGFGNIDRRDLWKFTHISARKTEAIPRATVALRF